MSAATSDLPLTLYHIQWKFRDEIRPRFGVMRGREFYMKDGYNFDLDRAAAIHAYNRHMVSYLRTYERMGLKAIPMRADTGPIGGDHSHEFLILADTGESEVFYDRHHSIWRLATGRSISTTGRPVRRSSIPGPRPMPAPTRPMIPACSLARCPKNGAAARAPSRSARSSISAPNTPNRWARR
jgi:hypothetical protein